MISQSEHTPPWSRETTVGATMYMDLGQTKNDTEVYTRGSNADIGNLFQNERNMKKKMM